MNRQKMNIVIAGHVDHGKSTVIGRLLADTNSLPTGKLDQVKAICERNSKPFEYAFLLDALKDEQSQGITIDTARIFFKSKKRDYIIIDAPGHIEFLKNMITGASHAEAALLVIDANEGVRENSRRHGYMLSMLGIKQIAVLVNKMDLVNFSETVFNSIVSEFSGFLKQVGITATHFVPISGRNGLNIVSHAEDMSWYKGKSVLEVLDLFEKEKPETEKPFRMPVQDVYKFTANGDDRRIIVGTIDSGTISVGDEILFLPSGKKSKILTIEGFNKPQLTESFAESAVGFTLEEQIYITRGELAVRANQIQPETATQIQVTIFWLGKNPLTLSTQFFIKLGTAKIQASLTKVIRVLDASTLNTSDEKSAVNRHEVAECILTLKKPVVFDTSDDLIKTARFVLVENYEISGGGIVRKSVQHSGYSMSKNDDIAYSEMSIKERFGYTNHLPSVIVLSYHFTSIDSLEADLLKSGEWIFSLTLNSVNADSLSVLREKVELLVLSGTSVLLSIPKSDEFELKSVFESLKTDDISLHYISKSHAQRVEFETIFTGINRIDGLPDRITLKLNERTAFPSLI